MNVIEHPYRKIIPINTINVCNCDICLDELQTDLFKLDCGHLFHKDCVKKHIETKLQNNTKIICPFPNCNGEISHLTIAKIDNDLLNEFIINNIDNDPNTCLCYKCKQTYTTKKDNNFIDYCKKCCTTHCFQCGISHKKYLTCFEASNEKQIFDDFYRNKNITLKLCPHCKFPQEKLDGCNTMKCGLNAHDKNLRIQGCGKLFNWNDAPIYRIANRTNDIPIYHIANVTNNNTDETDNETNNTHFFGVLCTKIQNIFECLTVVLFLSYFTSLILLFVYVDKLDNKHCDNKTIMCPYYVTYGKVQNIDMSYEYITACKDNKCKTTLYCKFDYSAKYEQNKTCGGDFVDSFDSIKNCYDYKNKYQNKLTEIFVLKENESYCKLNYNRYSKNKVHENKKQLQNTKICLMISLIISGIHVILLFFVIVLECTQRGSICPLCCLIFTLQSVIVVTGLYCIFKNS